MAASSTRLQRFAAAAAAPILLNLSLIVALLVAVYFPTPGHAAAWGVLVSGVLQALLVGGDAWRTKCWRGLRRPRLDADVRQFFRALGPATLGSAGVQLALFADTMIASFLPAGALSALYYADRLNQLPIGVIGIAAGTVVLPEMARRLAAGDEAGAAHAQNRAVEFTLLMAIPCLAAFFVIPDLIMRALFVRGAFTDADALAAGRTLAAYAVGLLPFVLIRSAVATFFARGDTATPVKAALIAAAVNIGFKVLLMGPLAQVGLALATSIGAWINLRWWSGLRIRAGHIRIDDAAAAIGGQTGRWPAWRWRRCCGLPPRRWRGCSPACRLHDVATLAALAALGGTLYAGMVFAIFGRRWLAAFRAPRALTSGLCRHGANAKHSVQMCMRE